ncbi:MAG TPA: ABC transporter substrate-binding protein, partial [Thermoanaerobaculia bacterium]
EGGDRRLQGEARLLLASAHRLASNIDAALREAEAAIRIFDDEKNAAQGVEALVLASETAWQGRRIDETRTFLDRGIDAARAVGDLGNLLRLLSLGATVANLRGDHPKVKQYLDEAERIKAGTREKAKDEEVPRGGRLVVALANPAPAHEPAEMGLDEEVEILSLVFETLVKTDEQGHLVPWLCEKWEMRDGGRSILITLRKEVHFDDGTPLTAKAVKDSFERAIRIRTREIPAAFAAIPGVAVKTGAASIDSIVVHDDQRLEIHLAEALPIYPALLTDPTTAIVLPADGKGVVGSGPFRIMSRGEESVVLGADARYWRATIPPLETIEFRTFASATAIASGLRAGEIDLARDLTPQDFDDTLRDPRFRHGLVEAPKKNTYFIVFNLTSPHVVNAEVRRALCGVFRIHDLVWRTLGRLAQPASSLIPPGIFGHDPGRRRATLTREQAVEKIRAAVPNARLQLHAAVHPLLQDRYRSLLQALLDVWRELGVDVVNETPTMEAYLRSFQVNDGIDLMIGRWNADYDDPDNFTNGLFHSRTGVLSLYFASPETDALLEEARTESHPAAREIHYRKFENVMIDSAVVFPLFHDIDYRIASPKVRKLHLRNSPPYVNYAEVGKVETAEAPAIVTRASGGIVYVPIAEDISSLDPVYSGTVEKAEVIPNIFDTLTRTSEEARVVPWLASEFAAEDGGRRYRFKLRDDVRFHDGRRLTSRDVRYSWERLLATDAPQGATRYFLAPIRGAKELIRGEAEDLAGFHILSSREFTVELETPLSFFPALISHIATAIVQEGTDAVSGNWREHCIGTGAFRVVQFEPGRLLELERNPNYWRQGLPKSDGIVFRFGVTPEEIRNEFRAGRLSIACELFPSDVEAFRHDPELAAGYRETPRLSTYFAAFQCKSGPLADGTLRRQLVQGIDIAGIVARTLGRLAIPAHGIIPPGLLGYVAAPMTH